MYFSSRHFLVDFYKEASFFKRGLVDGFRNVFMIFPGDILEVFFFKKGNPFIFEGVCLGISGKHLRMPDSSFILRNFVQSVGIECVFSYFYNRVYFMHIHEYKNKSFIFSRSKFFFLRAILNRGTSKASS